jgi:hypothetical protein
MILCFVYPSWKNDLRLKVHVTIHRQEGLERDWNYVSNCHRRKL